MQGTIKVNHKRKSMPNAEEFRTQLRMWRIALKRAEKRTRYKTQYAGNGQVPAWPLIPTAYFVRLNKDFSKAKPKKDLTHMQYWSWGFSVPNNLCILHPSEGKKILNKCCYSYDLKTIPIQMDLHHSAHHRAEEKPY